jgi:hypothetical protein
MELAKTRKALLAPIGAEHVVTEPRHALDKRSATLAIIEPLAEFTAMRHSPMQFPLKLCAAEKKHFELEAARVSRLKRRDSCSDVSCSTDLYR